MLPEPEDGRDTIFYPNGKWIFRCEAIVLFKLFDESYLYPMPDLSSPLLSPGLAPDELLKTALPDQLVIISCGGDQLLAETERFRKRLVGLGKKVDGCVVDGVGHGWDKKSTFSRGDVQRDESYRLAIESLQESWSHF
jgi:acetyl esterase/lipase